MKHMRVFAGLSAPDASYGNILLFDITVTGCLGVSDSYRARCMPCGGPNTCLGVGGVILPTNNLAVLAPYLAMIGLVAVAVTVYATKRRH